MSVKKCMAGMLLAASMFLPFSIASAKPASSPVSNDDVFLALRESSIREDAVKAAELAARLKNYPIPSYVDYYRLKPRLKTAPQAEIRDFLKRYEGTAIADRLRNDWLLEIGKARDWALFDEQYPQFVLNDDTQLKCYALTSRIAKGVNVAEAARELLTVPKWYGDACLSLLTALTETRQFTEDDLWAQARLAMESNAVRLFRHVTALAGVPAAMIEQVLDKPAQLVQSPGRDRMAQELFVIAIGRLARADFEQAVAALTSAAPGMTARQQAQGWAEIAFLASLRLMPDAADYWRKAEGAVLSHESHEWKVRAALRVEDWALVKSAIEAMPRKLRDEPAWIYWRGRAYKAEGKSELAENLFRQISHRLDFYGQLALEELGEKVVVPAQAKPVTAEELAPMAANEGFRRAMKFFELNLRFEGIREWNWELRTMNERQLLAAAELARKKNVLDRMVNTSDRTAQELDFSQRFPMPFKDILQSVVQPLGLEKALVYGLIRQESRFIMNARSGVGASGLMQLMPGTARYVARKIGMSDFSLERINDVDVNLKLGSHYLSMVLASLDGSQILATAAYNAGPRRSVQWRARLSKPVEGAIFAESIPFTETRGYVKSVLANATYYAALTENKGQSLKSRLGIIEPKEAGQVTLP